MSTVIISDDMKQPYSSWVTDALHTLAEENCKKICISGLLPDGRVFTGYYNLETAEKLQISSAIQMDAAVDTVKANLAEILADSGLQLIVDEEDDDDIEDMMDGGTEDD